ncbi:hypothetical protein BDB00DRAFT_864762, partial [Zychaea mexicana]|uniref:uncharacterized protein n=1 Tax=Zychaea mexicana TaxID=64656 RepID=UPI0022FDFD88
NAGTHVALPPAIHTLFFLAVPYTLTCSISQFSCHRRSGTCWIFYSLCRRILFRGCLNSAGHIMALLGVLVSKAPLLDGLISWFSCAYQRCCA